VFRERHVIAFSLQVNVVTTVGAFKDDSIG
jgi:hypothetical protein